MQPELCSEAMYLGRMLLSEQRTCTPTTNALLAMMCLHAARIPARQSAEGELYTLFEQDRSLWDCALAEKGAEYLESAACGDVLSEFHIEAAIAQLHMRADSRETTPWGAIVSLYDQLLRIQPSPLVALSRAIAIGEHEGALAGLETLDTIAGRERLIAYPFYYATRGELELRLMRIEAARASFEKAKAHARNDSEARFFERRVSACRLV